MEKGGFEEALGGLEAGSEAAAGAGAPQGEEADPTSHVSVAALRAEFGDAVLHHTIMSGDEHVVYVAADRLIEILRWLRDTPDHRYDLLLDVSAVDYGGGRPLEVFYQLWSIPNRLALRLKVVLPLTSLEVDSAVPVWNSANWLEREAYDLFGIHFRGHPDLRRILMPDNYAEGHPLRKDFPLRGRFTRAEQTRRALSMAVEDFYTPDELRSAGVPGTVPGEDAPAVSPGEGARGDVRPGSSAARATSPDTPGRPNEEDDWAPGPSGSAADGAPGPGGAES